MGITSVGNDLFSQIDKVMSKIRVLADGFIEDLYDSKQILLKSMIAEVGKGSFREIWKISDMRPENKKHIHFSSSQSYFIPLFMFQYIPWCYYFRVMMISTVAGFQIQMVPSQWYIDNQKDKDVVAETCCFINQEAMQNFSGETLIPNPSTVPITAAQFAVEHDSYGIMIAWLRKFIDQHKEIMSTSAESVQDQDYP
ncbi:hypothetical protein Glove_82g6 [Diversispora epigaea]|uniref:Uncharacterized protein n=1 Tax=Diversispora epigaea TaxID=1348612 RepID=A0A397JBA2_9GLOM|nr:hypothetical protein Glove_82g6 [Diversispora epigaea]